ncbi:MAG TPA: cupin domain-containing protein [Gaiellaceae bacterium]|jgi:uncharacterized RmlC-like cupin family protein
MAIDVKSDWTKEVVHLRPRKVEIAKQDLEALFGVNEVTAGSRGLSMLVTMLAPGKCSNAHYHIDSETSIYGVSGHARMFYGDDLEHVHDIGPGDFVYIPPFCPHKTYNLSREERAVFVTARTDPFEQERVVVLPEVDHGQCESRVEYID